MASVLTLVLNDRKDPLDFRLVFEHFKQGFFDLPFLRQIPAPIRFLDFSDHIVEAHSRKGNQEAGPIRSAA